ncbi:eEF1A lysine and N-terminal methyltransferase homolog [Culicoides brevitarsis]|uniref:eEF1A lysine and N-terminal methyltransferase homolog n=1 Tax=Culicoides brevitarsis TaxID=469753 RepID=UPI00307B9D2E
MNLLLPKTTSEFGSTKYWDQFFKARGKAAFEWYGEYPELCGILHKYIKPKDDILVVGCGNSKLSADLYDVGIKKIVNVDISATVINQMLKANRSRSEMQWLQGDVTQMKEFNEETFSVVLDKGTLDALMTDDSAEVLNRVSAYLSEMSRVLKIGGRFICVSLLQPHILKLLLATLPANNFMFRVVRCVEAERKTAETSSDGTSMPVFVVVATKFKALPQKLLEICMCGDKIQRLTSEAEVSAVINDVQQSSMVTNGLVKDSSAALSNEIKLELHTADDKDKPRYTIHVLDQKPKRGNGKFAAFIVPQGREVDWLFSTPPGRRKLQESSGHDRLAIVSMHRDFTYPDWERVQEELNPYIRNLAPNGSSAKIPYLSLDSNVGHRELICKGKSDFSGPYVIEDVLCDNNQLFRRLIFMQNQNTIQSEALLKMSHAKDGTVMKKFVDKTYLACQHHLYMTAGLNIFNTTKSKNKKSTKTEALLVGLGGGGLVSFIQEMLKNVKITAIELDPSILSIATEFFELNQTKNLEVVIQDGLEYLKEASKMENPKKLNAVLFDVDSKDTSIGMSCPPKDFLSPEIIDAVKKILKDDGLFILNLVCRDDELREKVIADLKKDFKAVCSFKLEEDLNEIVYCSASEAPLDAEKWKKMFEKSAKELNQLACSQKIVAQDDELIEITDFLSNLKV